MEFWSRKEPRYDIPSLFILFPAIESSLITLFLHRDLARAIHPVDFSELLSRFKFTMLLLTARLGPINLNPWSVIPFLDRSRDVSFSAGYSRYSANFSETLSPISVFETFIFFREVLVFK